MIPGLGRSLGKRIGYPPTPVFLGFPCGSAVKESACNVRDLVSFPGLERSPGEGKGHQLQPWDLPFLQAWLLVVENATWKLTHGLATPLPFLVAQMIKNLPAVQETWVRSLGWKDPLEKGMSTHSSILAWEIAWAEEPVRLQSMESQRVGYD